MKMHLTKENEEAKIVVEDKKLTAKTPPLPRRRINTRRRFTGEEVYKIRKERLAGATIKFLADKYGVTRPTIGSVLYGLGTYSKD